MGINMFSACVLFVGAISMTMCSVLAEDDTCKDLVACNRYAPEICTDSQYFDWTKTNCPNYCGLCSVTTVSHLGEGRFMDSDGYTGSTTCVDVNDKCAEYGQVICEDVKFYNWVNENCVKHCNRCDNSCKDTIDNCAEYGADVCETMSYYNWVEMHCRKYCARCTR